MDSEQLLKLNIMQSPQRLKICGQTLIELIGSTLMGLLQDLSDLIDTLLSVDLLKYTAYRLLFWCR